MPEREQLIEVGVALSAVLIMISTLFWIGSTYGGEGGTLSPEGGQMFVGAIVAFILLMTAVGVALAYTLNDPEDGLEPGGDSDGNGTF
ncbi:hypothetical protein ACFQGT_13735 [Natrialbaceae archaeon GCM10025810]|uniref:DUF7472 family protein n=1 Tax=Halovalidus salilacus TaxID=3075124 RepID=UPI0036120ED9